MLARRVLLRGLSFVLALTAVTAVTTEAAAAGGPSVNAPDVKSVAVSNGSMSSRGPDEATTRALKNDQPAAGSQEGSGSFAATPLSASASWEVSKQSGDFTWSYPLRVPPSPGGFAPSLGLSYRSSAVDGLTSATNNQPSWLGDGWDLSVGFIERAYGGCADDSSGGTTPPKTGDLCWRSDNATAAYGGQGGMLIKDDHTGVWRPKSDDRSRVERLTGTANGDDNGESWKITTVDGAQYFFGSRPESKSTWTVPVFGDDDNEPCHAGTFDASSCNQAWRWNLDKVVDPRGNVILYTYETETNNYGRNLKDAAASYVRAGTLKRVEYGLRDDVAGPATGRVEFGLADRCVKDSTCTFDRKENWPDAPVSERCDTGTCKDKHSPTFWSTKRLSTITTQVLRGSNYVDVDRWTLQHEFPKADDIYQAALWLKGITHTGLVGGEFSLPAVTFEGSAMPNRVDTPTGIGPLNRYRVTGVISEAGGITTIKYAKPDCVPGGPMPVNAESNTLRCYPVTWTKKDHAERTDHFHKYVVEAVTTSDRLAASAEQVVRYEYLDGAAWHHDQSEFTKDDKKTWNEFRGYGRVRTRAGVDTDPSGKVTMTEDRFYRGMHGDKLPNGTRTASVTDSEGGVREDSDWLQGFSFESQTHNGTGESVVTKTISTPTWVGPNAVRGPYKSYWVASGSSTSYTALRSGGWRMTKVESKYDDHGQVYETNDLGDVSSADDDRCVRTSYKQNEARWMWSLPEESETVSVHCGAQATFPDHSVTGTKNTHDDNGNVTKVEALDKRPASGPVWALVATSTHDAYGRIRTATDAMGNTTKTEYSPATGVATGGVVTDALGHTITSTIEPAWGVPTKVVDVNGNTTEAVYDPLGRTSKVWKANRLREDFETLPSLTITYDIQRDAPSSVTTVSLAPRGNYLTSTNVYDGQYRIRQAQTPTEGGRLIVDTKYDSQGRTVRTTQPFFNANPVDTKLLNFSETDVPGLTRAEYDEAGRPSVSIFQGGGQEKWRTTTSYGGDRVDVTPPQGGTPTTTITDARGQTRELWQYKGGVPSGDHDTTQYTYTSAGQLASTVDAMGNTWRWKYDLRGRLVRTEDVDKGTSTMTYDALSRIDTVTDARGTTLKYGYDVLSRKKTVHSGATLLQEFKYDTALYGKGQLGSATRYVNGHAYTSRVLAYTEFYQPIYTEVEIPEIEGPLKGVYRSSFGYKPDGSLGGHVHPAVPAAGLKSETMLISYDDLGRQVELSGNNAQGEGTDMLVNSTKFTRYGELYRLELGTTNRTWLSFYYDDNTRRLNRYIVDAEVPAPMQADVNYSYDPAGNITSVEDRPREQPVDRQCFKYDHLRRLTEAWTPSSACSSAPATGSLSGPAPYWHSYTYNEAGNRLTEVQHAASGDTSRTYAYPEPGSPRPHAVSSVTTAGPGVNRIDEFHYNEIGSTSSRKVAGVSQTLDWDAEGRVVKVTEGPKVSEFLYGADGSRLIRRDPDATTLYIGGQELRLAKGASAPTVTRYYSHAGKVVAMREGKTKLTWLASDRQGTSQIAIDKSSLKVDRRRQLPFGGPRGEASAFPGERGFVGGTNDAATGLVHIGARQYDAALGKFISVDPIMDPADPQQWNAYAYANNSPVTFSDPTGLITCPDGDCRNKGPTGNKGTPVSSPPVKNHGHGIQETRDPETGAVAINGYQLPANAPNSERLVRGMITRIKAENSYFWQPAPDGQLDVIQTLIALEAACVGMPTSECGVDVERLFFNHRGIATGLTNGLEFGNVSMSPLNGPMSQVSGKNIRAAGVPYCKNSFTGDTKVLMADGATKRIDEIKVGDQVANSEPESKVLGEHEVLAVHVTDTDSEYVELTVSTLLGPKVVRATANHPFYSVTTGDWVDAGDLGAGQRLNTASNGRVVVAATFPYNAKAQTYNLTVDTVSTYYILAGESPVLVHNCGGATVGWANKADFSNQKTLAKKYDAHAADFGIVGNRNKSNLAAFENAMRDHMKAARTKIYRFDYRGQGQAIGFIDSGNNNMVMLRADTGQFWTAYRLGDKQFAGIVDKGRLW